MKPLHLDASFAPAERVYDVLAYDGYRCTVDVPPTRGDRLLALLRRVYRVQCPLSLTAQTQHHDGTVWEHDILVVGTLFAFARLPSTRYGPRKMRVGIHVLPFDTMPT